MTGTDYEVLIVKYGTRETPRSGVFLNYGIYDVPDEPIGMDYFVWVVRNADRTIVLDTGYSVAGGRARNRTTLITPPDALRGLGVEFGSTTTLVLSHAHYDHTGNIDAFPESTIVMTDRELAFWTSPMASRKQFHHSVQDEDLAEITRAGAEGRLSTFSGSHDLAPGIELLEIGGHTDGQLVMKVQTSAGTALLASDAVHYYAELDTDMPFTYVSDLPAMYAGFDRINAMVASGEVAHVVSGHDPSTLGRFPAFDDSGLIAIIGRLELS